MDTDLVKKATKTMINNSKYYRKGAYVALHLKKKFHFQTFQNNFWLNFH